MLKVDNLCFSYGKTPILEDISFELPEASILGILGKNGAGKSTLVKCLNGLNRVSAGHVILHDKDLYGMDIASIAQEIGYVPQRVPEENMTVFESILIGRKPLIHFQTSGKDLYMVQEIIKYIGLQFIAFKHTNQISGGEFQKVLIARALVRDPAILLLDEPTNNLDLASQVKIMELLVHNAKFHKKSIVMIVHDINLAFQYSDYLLLLKDGKITKYDHTEKIDKTDLEFIYNVKLAQFSLNENRIFMPQGASDDT